ncbi:hypothetical protein D9M71_594750 [compost metagenome]
MNSSHSLMGCSMTSATLTFGAGADCAASSALPQADNTSTAARARGIRKGLTERSMRKTPPVSGFNGRSLRAVVRMD